MNLSPYAILFYAYTISHLYKHLIVINLHMIQALLLVTATNNEYIHSNIHNIGLTNCKLIISYINPLPSSSTIVTVTSPGMPRITRLGNDV